MMLSDLMNNRLFIFILGVFAAASVLFLMKSFINRIFSKLRLEKYTILSTDLLPEKGSSKNKLLEAEKRFHTLVNNIPGAFYRCFNRDGWEMIFLSNYISQITGYDAPELIGNKVRSYESIIFKEDQKKVNDVVRDGLIMEDSYVLEYRIVHKSGAIRWVYEKGRCIVTEGGENILDGVIFDITDRKIFEDQLKQAQKMELIGTLASGYAHDMNNILGGITASSSFIQYLIKNENTGLNEKIREHLTIVDDCVRRASNAIDHLLQFNIMDDVSFSPIDLKTAIDNTVKLCRISFDKSVKIMTDLPETAVKMMGNEDQIQQVLLNLMINAEHAMTTMHKDGEQWGGKLKVSLRSYMGDIYHLPEEHKQKLWHILIEDEGVGIDESIINDIFTPFYTTKSRKGTGLGLSMVNHIVMNHNGIVRVESKPGEGSKFHILFPKVRDYSIYQSQPQSFLSVPRGTGHILGVDDEELIRKLCQEMLKQCGYEVMTASSGSEAYKIFSDNPDTFELVILDFVLPDMSGDELMEKLKQIREPVKIILASGYISDERINSMTKHGLNGYIHKPYSITSLSEKVNEVLRSQPSNNE